MNILAKDDGYTKMVKQSTQSGECDKCGAKTKLMRYDSDTGYTDFYCGKCRGYGSDKEFIDEQERWDREMYREWKKEQNRMRTK
jgi:hypothetical protein